MRTWLGTIAFQGRRIVTALARPAGVLIATAATCWAQPASEAAGGEASLKLPDLSSVSFLTAPLMATSYC